MDQFDNVVLDPIDFVPDTLINAVVYGAADEKIGTINHVHGMGAASKVAIDVGGFLGFGTKSVLLAATDLTFMRSADGSVHARTGLTKDQIKAMPEHSG